jgi:glucose/arabinose dehydrogenase
MDRRQFLAVGGAAGLSGLAGCAFRQSTESDVLDGMEISLAVEIEGLSFPTTIAVLPNGDWLVGERFGQVLLFSDDGPQEAPFLDVTEQLAELGAERGLLGLALHPDFPETSTCYVRYSGKLTDDLSAEEYTHRELLSEFEVTADMTGVVPDSERILLEIPEPGRVHNAGDLAFGPDGYLYVPLGDGQRTNFTPSEKLWWYDQGKSAQDTENNLLGGILRIDVDDSSGDRPYGIPSSNPLVGEAGRDEYFAWGLRNPYRISFDDGRLFVGDVGEHIRESIYLVERGDNCGWPILEGSSCPAGTSIGHKINENPVNILNPKTWLAQTNRISPVKVCPTSERTGDSFTDPIAEYQRTGMRAVTGGYVYRGDESSDLAGQYIFGDFAPPAPLFAMDPDSDAESPQDVTELVVSSTDHGRLDANLISFARDPAGEVYALTTELSEGTGKIHRIVPSE